MKYIKAKMVFGVVFSLLLVSLSAQTTMKIDVNAKVVDADGKPVAGAIVVSKADNVTMALDASGVFVANVTLNTTLSVNALGFKPRYVEATPDLKIIELTKDLTLVQIAYRKVNKEDLLNGVSYVNVTEVIHKNHTSYSLDGMEALTSGFHGNMWGMNTYLVLVDGVPRDAGNVLSSEIEQISFLKGASAVVLYGSRAAKGVIYITTKRGDSNAQKIKITANTGLNFPKSYPKYLNSADYMTLYNEARVNDGLDELYSAEEIYHHASGENPYRYPDVDYYSSDYLKKAYGRTDVTGEVYGGGKVARYYTNFGFIHAGSLLNFGEAVDNGGSNRFNIRGNIDMDLNDFITVNVDATAIFYTGKGVNADYWSSAATLRPHRFAPLIPVSMIDQSDEASMTYVNTSSHLIDGKYLLGGTQLDQTNPFAAIYAGGTNKYNSRQFQFNTGIDADLSGLLKGLSFKTMLAVDYSSTYLLSYNNTYAVYEASWNNYAGADQISSLKKYGNDSKSGKQNVANSWYRQTMAFSGQLNYKRSWNEKHNVSAMLIAAGFQQTESEVYHRTSNANLGIHAGYNYEHRYYIDLNGAWIHSAKLPIDNRCAFSPSLALGWRISKESFMEGISAIDDLKLTASASILNTDLDISGFYLYQGYYTYNDAAWYSWRDGALVHTFDRRRGSNPNMEYPKRREISLGLEGSLFHKMISFNGSLFASRMTGNIIQTSVMFPSYFTSYYPVYSDIPYVNFNEDERKGFDFYLNLNKTIGKIDWNLGLSGTYYDTKAIKRDENFEYDYQNRSGKPLDGLWGLENAGFFVDQTDIGTSPKQSFGEVKPGDIKYIDQNNDNVIDTKDEVYLGKGGWFGAPFTLGVNLSAKWKNLTFFALGIGRYGAHAMKNNSYYWVDGEDKYSEVVVDRWTEATQETAKYPRLTTENSDNNFRSSDFWIYSTDRFDLAKVQVTYKLPNGILSRTFIDDMEVYVNGYNLLTLSPERKALELNVGSSPQTRFFNLGVKAVF